MTSPHKTNSKTKNQHQTNTQQDTNTITSQTVTSTQTDISIEHLKITKRGRTPLHAYPMAPAPAGRTSC